ncbi:MAG: hypothetical protein LBC41_09385, partial [Clostridiales bacterium]|nr:hypothetical protein [Clostridiales bacterium]
LANLALVYLVPCLAHFDRSQRKTQYKTSLILVCALGVVTPLLLTVPFGASLKCVLLYLLLHIISWTANFLLSSLAVSASAIKSFSLWG